MNKNETAPERIVTRTAFAEMIGRSKARVTQLCAAGMAGVLPDKRIDVAAALQWLERNHSGHGGGWGSGSRGNDRKPITVRGGQSTPAHSGPIAKAGHTSRQRERAEEQKTSSATASSGADVASPEVIRIVRWSARLDLFKELTGPGAITHYVSMARSLQFSPAQAFLIGMMAYIVPVWLAGADLTQAEFEVAEVNWRELLGDLRFDQLEETFNAALFADFPAPSEVAR